MLVYAPDFGVKIQRLTLLLEVRYSREGYVIYSRFYPSCVLLFFNYEVNFLIKPPIVIITEYLTRFRPGNFEPEPDPTQPDVYAMIQ